MADYSGTTNSTVYSGKEFKCYIGADWADGTNDVGTINASTDGASMYRLDIDGFTLPTFSPNQEFEMRSGSGRVAEFGQVFSSSKRVITEISLSGRLTMQDLPIFMENILSQAGTTTPGNQFVLATGYNPTNFKHNDATGATVWNKTLTLHFVAPNAADSYTIPGCVCTSLSLSSDMDTVSGRYSYSATFQSAYQATKGSDSMASANELTTTNGSTYVYLSDQSVRDLNIHNAGTANDATSVSPVFKSLNLTIENPTQFLGAQGTDANPEVFARAVPELTITVSGSMKYDAETDPMIEAFRDPDGTSYVQMVVNNRAITSNLETLASIALTAHASQLFGFIVPKAKLTSCEVGGDDVAMINFEMKVLDPESNNVFHVATGATAS